MNSRHSKPLFIVARAFKRFVVLIVSASLFIVSTFNANAGAINEEEKPVNILLILADDLGYSDIGAFGGEINTPNLDKLAADGLVMTNFHVGPTCSVSRKMLFTGVDLRPQRAPSAGKKARKKNPFFSIDHTAVTFSQILNANGYSTYMVGKWDLGPKGRPALKKGSNPMDHGFDKAFWLKNGGGSHYSDMRPLVKNPSPTIEYFQNREKIETLPDDFYSSTYYTDKLIEFIDAHKDANSPFFAYATYSAPHSPLHAPKDTIAKYAGVYDEGYLKVREKRIQNMRELGIIGRHQKPANLSSDWPAWEELTPELKASEIRRMQVHAAMVDSMDENIGRLISHLKESGHYDNTLIIFFSDNGADGNNPADLSPPGWLADNFDNSLDNIGLENSYEAIGPNWASVSSAPFKLYKAFISEGGTRSPFIAVNNKLIKRRGVSNSFATLADIFPTFLEVAGINESDSQENPQNASRHKGASILSYFAGKSPTAHPANYVHATEYWNRKSVRQGGWKATWINKPFGSQRWELFNLQNDIGEQFDLSAEHPETLKTLVRYYEEYANDAGVVDDPNFFIKYSNTMNFYQ